MENQKVSSTSDKRVISPVITDLRQQVAAEFPSADKTTIDLLLSFLVKESPSFTMNRFFDWLRVCNENTTLTITHLPLADLKDWSFDLHNNLRHKTGRFFSVEGISVSITGCNSDYAWEQPIINQPEIGILGIIVQRRHGILHFLLQGKIEPGNINGVQLSPTLQATHSNYTQAHGGNSPSYLDWFLDRSLSTVLVDQLQTEQGARFLKKRNRNMILIIHEDVEIDTLENFCWMTLGQIKELMTLDNIVNMDTRAVLSCIQFTEEQTNDRS